MMACTKETVEREADGFKRSTGGKQQNFTAAWKRVGEEKVQLPSVYGLTREPFF